MGGLLHIFEFNPGRMAKKVYAHKRNNDGMENPRSSVKLQIERAQIHCQDGELQCYYQVEGGWSKNCSNSNVTPVKKLNNEKLSKNSGTRNNAPSLVARLMGIDTMPLPVDTKSVVLSDESKHEDIERKLQMNGMNGKGSVNRTEFGSFYQDIDGDDDDGWGQNYGKPRLREHPQEKELLKFKREFEAYQAAMRKKCSYVVEIGSVSRKMLSQENLSNEKMQHNSHSFKTKILNNDDMMESISTRIIEPFPSSNRTLNRVFEESLVMKSRSRIDIISSPTQIVILKPSSDSICNCIYEENCITFQGKKGEDFLEEVRQRLKCELQGKTFRKGSVIRSSGFETPYDEKTSNPPNDMVHHIAKDMEWNLPCSESARTFKTEIQLSGSSSPEFFNRDTRMFLSERLRNNVKRELHFEIPHSRSYTLDSDRVSLKQNEDSRKCANYMSDWELVKSKLEIPAGSYGHKTDDNVLLHKELSPRNLARSLSAPVSGTSFGRLLLEDRHLLTGAHIQRKLEVAGEMPIQKWKKDKFNIKEKVSKFKHSLGLRGKLFGKRVQSIVESQGNEYGPILKDIRSGPTVLMKYGERNENSTEVPPSPASVCSCAQEEHWGQAEYLSPISTPDVYSLDDAVTPKAFRDINYGVNVDLAELRKQISQLDSDGPEDFTTKHELAESELVQLDDPAQSYVRDLLVASGLYFGSWDKSLLRGDSLTKPISNSVFIKVEESHKKLLNENERPIKDQNKLEHKVLLDLLNEALSNVLGPPLTLSRFKRKLSNSSMPPPPCGKELLKLVWDIIRVSLYPTSNFSPFTLDFFVAQDLGSMSWCGLMNDQLNILEREIECLITNDLVEELLDVL